MQNPKTKYRWMYIITASSDSQHPSSSHPHPTKDSNPSPSSASRQLAQMRIDSRNCHGRHRDSVEGEEASHPTCIQRPVVDSRSCCPGRMDSRPVGCGEWQRCAVVVRLRILIVLSLLIMMMWLEDRRWFDTGTAVGSNVVLGLPRSRPCFCG